MAVKKVVYLGRVLGGMMLLVAVFSMLVQAATQKVIIDVPGSFVMNGKNITVLGMSVESVSVDVDGVVEGVDLDKVNNLTKNVNGALIHIIAISMAQQRVILNVTVNVNCGNKVCEVGEDFSICCADCGCSTANRVCVMNRCLENTTSTGAQNQCYADADCNDKNSCTTERCDTSKFPNKCIRTDVTSCVAGDQCCPKMCDADKDADCAQIDKCDADADCKDSEACTQETCAGKPKRCQYAVQEGCTYENVCIVKGTVKEGRYCEGKSHEWLLQKVDKQPCANDFECLAGICTNEICGKTKSNMLRYAFYTIGVLAVIIVVWYVALTKKIKPSRPSSDQS